MNFLMFLKTNKILQVYLKSYILKSSKIDLYLIYE